MKTTESQPFNDISLEFGLKQAHQQNSFQFCEHAFRSDKKHFSVQKQITLVTSVKYLQQNSNMKTNCQDKIDWPSQDQQKLFQLQLRYGNKWSIISTHLPGKSDNCIKNKFYSTLRKGFRKMNKYITNIRRKHFKTQTSVNKLLKPQFLTKLAAISDRNFQQKYEVKQKAINISQNIQQRLIQLAQHTNDYQTNHPKDFSFEEDLLAQIQQFNRNCKRRKGKRKSKGQNRHNQQFQSKSCGQSQQQQVKSLKSDKKQLLLRQQNEEFTYVKAQKIQAKRQSNQEKHYFKAPQIFPHQNQQKYPNQFNVQDELKPNEFLNFQENFSTANAFAVLNTPSYSVASHPGSLAHIIDPSPCNFSESFKHAYFLGMYGMKKIQTSLLQTSLTSENSFFFRSRNSRQRQDCAFIQNIPLINHSNQSSLLFNSTSLSKSFEPQVEEKSISQKKLSSSANYQSQKSFSSFRRSSVDFNVNQSQQVSPMKKKISVIQQNQNHEQCELQK